MMRRRHRTLAVMTTVAITAATAAVVFVDTLVLTATPAGADATDDRVLLITDSVVLSAEPALRDAFADKQLTVLGNPAIFTRDAVGLVAPNAHAIGRVSIIATGYNFPFWDPGRFVASVDAMVDALVAAGSERVVWVLLREVTRENSPTSSWWQVDRYAFYFPDVNALLRQALARNPELSLADWPSRSRVEGDTYDSIHLNTQGQRKMADLLRSDYEKALFGGAARDTWLRRLSGLTGAPRTLPAGDPCAGFGSWAQANDSYWSVARSGDTGWLDPDLDLVPCEARADAPSAPTGPAPAPLAFYPEATLFDAAKEPRHLGYWMAGLFGDVFGFGDARAIAPHVDALVTAIAPAGGGGYWALSPDGTVHARGAAAHGDARLAVALTGEVASSLAAGPDLDHDGVADGYWVFTNAGRAIGFGSARHHGDMSATVLNGPIVSSVATPDGGGYWMVGDDGGVFSFGNAAFYGSTGNLALNQPVNGIVADPDGRGYWLVAADGGIFAFDAPFRGSAGALALNEPIVGAVSHGSGYLLVARDGGIFNFSNREFQGSLGDRPPQVPIVAVGTLR